MIVSASYRTDIPAFYTDWFLRRLGAGFVRVANPYGGPPSVISLDPVDVDGFVFWTRNIGPFLPALDRVAGTGVPFVVQFTLTGYPRPLDAATIDPDRAIKQIRALAHAFGSDCVVWRYDPIVFSSLSQPAWHEHNIARLADRLAGLVDEVIVSCVQIYRKTRRNLDAATRQSNFTWHDPADDTKQHLLLRLADLTRTRGIRLSLCDQPELRIAGIGEARCIDVNRLEKLAGRPLGATHKPHRRTCGCAQSRDIGAYDSCPHGCVYCYAVTSRAAAKRRHATHEPAGESLIPSSPRQTAQPDA